MPIITTGFEPTGDNWSFVDDEIAQTGVPGTQVVAEYVDSTLLTIAGIDLWGSIAIDDYVNAYQGSTGKRMYYVSRWRDPGSFLFGTYRLIGIHDA